MNEFEPTPSVYIFASEMPNDEALIDMIKKIDESRQARLQTSWWKTPKYMYPIVFGTGVIVGALGTNYIIEKKKRKKYSHK